MLLFAANENWFTPDIVIKYGIPLGMIVYFARWFFGYAGEFDPIRLFESAVEGAFLLAGLHLYTCITYYPHELIEFIDAEHKIVQHEGCTCKIDLIHAFEIQLGGAFASVISLIALFRKRHGENSQGSPKGQKR